jgi:hypothetical protein
MQLDGVNHISVDTCVGDIASLLDDRSKIHPVVEALYKRKAESSEQGRRVDGYKIGLAIEGGGMRGCVGAGMIYVSQL